MTDSSVCPNSPQWKQILWRPSYSTRIMDCGSSSRSKATEEGSCWLRSTATQTRANFSLIPKRVMLSTFIGFPNLLPRYKTMASWKHIDGTPCNFTQTAVFGAFALAG
ncbi:hypothetical protein SLA2020_001610 [Shorea laevis]